MTTDRLSDELAFRVQIGSGHVLQSGILTDDGLLHCQRGLASDSWMKLNLEDILEHGEQLTSDTLTGVSDTENTQLEIPLG
jgi:hypothetical protein